MFRLIPAYAGESARMCRSVRSIPTRMGELPDLSDGYFGVDPRAYGGIPSFSWTCSPSAVDPRVCGGTVDGLLQRAHVGGRSPRVRGNHPDRHQRLPHVRSIPACAGEPAQVCRGISFGSKSPATAGMTGYVLGNAQRIPSKWGVWANMQFPRSKELCPLFL